MEMRLTILGTSCSSPTKDRSLGGITFEFSGFHCLFDCGEGTQQAMMKADYRFMRLDVIFLSHFHADHLLGLPGLLATMTLNEREKPLVIFGPRGITEKVKLALNLAMLRPSFDIACAELKQGVILKADDFEISSFRVDHGIDAFGFCVKEKDKVGEFNRKKAEKLGIPVGPLYAKLQSGKSVKVKGKTFRPEQVIDKSKARKGRKVCIVMDTKPGGAYVKFVHGSDLLVHESVFSEEFRERAEETRHSTAREAAKIAKKARCKKLLLTHFSPRHKTLSIVKKEAQGIFPDTVIGRDLMTVSVPKNRAGKK